MSEVIDTFIRRTIYNSVFDITKNKNFRMRQLDAIPKDRPNSTSKLHAEEDVSISYVKYYEDKSHNVYLEYYFNTKARKNVLGKAKDMVYTRINKTFTKSMGFNINAKGIVIDLEDDTITDSSKLTMDTIALWKLPRTGKYQFISDKTYVAPLILNILTEFPNNGEKTQVLRNYLDSVERINKKYDLSSASHMEEYEKAYEEYRKLFKSTFGIELPTQTEVENNSTTLILQTYDKSIENAYHPFADDIWEPKGDF